MVREDMQASMMEINPQDVQEEEEIKEPLLNSPSSKGGFRTLPFILAHQGLETLAYYGFEPNMITYLMEGYGVEMAYGTNVLNLWSAATNFTPILGAFVADSYMGRFRMITCGCVIELLGMMMLLSTAIIPGARPSCDNLFTNSCGSAPLQLTLLFSSYALMSIGAGGVRSSNLAFGADQLSSTRAGVLEKYFNWGFFMYCVSVLFSQTFVVFIQDHIGWEVGFGVPLLFMIFSAISLLLGSSLYVKLEPKGGSLITGMVQVVVASWRNRHFDLSSPSGIKYLVAEGSNVDVPSKTLRFLNKACVTNCSTKAIGESVVDPISWSQCTVDQVEELKSIIKIIPFWSIAMFACIGGAQTSFRMVQANFMDRHVFTSSFEIPSASFGNFTMLTTILWLAIYDTMVLPLASMVMGKVVHLKVKTRMGIGLICTILSMVVSAIVESIRRGMATSGGRSQMSALWLVPQLGLMGISQALIPIACNDYFYSELPSSMSSFATNLSRLALSIASLVASVIVTVVDSATRKWSKDSWVSSDPNKGHYDYYYWALAGLSLLNYICFVLISRGCDQARRISSL